MKRNGFTLVEILCIIIILSILSSILFPIFATAKMSAKAGASQQNLRGFWLGLKIYQADNDEKAEFGEADEMGLPPATNDWLNFVNSYTGDYHYGWETKKQFLPCGISVDNDDFQGLGYMPLNKMDWSKNIRQYQENTILMFDKNCNKPGTRIKCQFCKKRSIGVTLGGSIRDRFSSDFKVDNQKFYN